MNYSHNHEQKHNQEHNLNQEHNQIRIMSRSVGKDRVLCVEAISGGSVKAE